VGPRAGLVVMGRDKSLTGAGIRVSDRPALSLVIVLTSLCRLPVYCSI
jgi:hypothetical protein